jgi:hypothetical protein
VTVRKITAIPVSWNDTDGRSAAVSAARDWSGPRAVALGLVLLTLPLASPVPAVEFQVTPVARRAIGEPYFILYSPERFGTRLWLGGPGPERRYVPGTTIVDLTDSIYEIGIGCAPRVALSRSGHHVNDPSIVRRPSDGALLMYFTSANSVNAWPNMLSLAVSTDNGQTWVDQGDLGLGWTPSALLQKLAGEGGRFNPVRAPGAA